MKDVMLVLSITNPKTGLRENKAVVNNKKDLVEFVKNNNNSLINIDAFKLGFIGNLPEHHTSLELDEQMYVEDLEDLIKELTL